METSLGGFTQRRSTNIQTKIDYEDYDVFKTYLRDLADNLFPFDSYQQYQDEILYETLDAYLIDDYLNVVIEGPTGIGKSAINVTVPRVLGVIAQDQREIENHFGVSISHLQDGSAFYTTPQKSLRNQLAEDQDLEPFVSMLKGRRDYTCGSSGSNCQECPIKADIQQSCRDEPNCTYWNEKSGSIKSHIAVITFAMQIIDNYLPPADMNGILSFKDRDLVIVDEGHNSESQSASLFAGFTLSPWAMPPKVYGDAGDKVDSDADRFEDVEMLVEEIRMRASRFVTEHEEDPHMNALVEECENIIRKIEYAQQTHRDGEAWVTNVEPVQRRNSNGKTQKIQIKPVRVNDFLADFVWSRGRRSLITSATIPFRGNISKWAKRIGIDDQVKFISKKTPFPEEHRLIHLNTMVGPMDSNNEDENWPDAMKQIKEISSHHEDENGVIHCVSYSRGKRVADSLGRSNIVLDKADKETDAMMTKWQNSDKDIFVSPSVTEGVDLHTDKARWQVLLKVPYGYLGDSRVKYLCFEEKEWGWYTEEAAIDIIQAVGRAVRGPEPEEAASFYVIDEKFDDVMYQTNPPEYFVEAVRDDPPEHWENPDAAPWR